MGSFADWMQLERVWFFHYGGVYSGPRLPLFANGKLLSNNNYLHISFTIYCWIFMFMFFFTDFLNIYFLTMSMSVLQHFSVIWRYTSVFAPDASRFPLHDFIPILPKCVKSKFDQISYAHGTNPRCVCVFVWSIPRFRGGF